MLLADRQMRAYTLEVSHHGIVITGFSSLGSGGAFERYSSRSCLETDPYPWAKEQMPRAGPLEVLSPIPDLSSFSMTRLIIPRGHARCRPALSSTGLHYGQRVVRRKRQRQQRHVGCSRERVRAQLLVSGWKMDGCEVDWKGQQDPFGVEGKEMEFLTKVGSMVKALFGGGSLLRRRCRSLEGEDSRDG